MKAWFILFPSLIFWFWCGLLRVHAFLANLLGERGSLARRSTARRRHRYWTRERALRLAFLSALQVTNAATYQVRSNDNILRSINQREISTTWGLVDRSSRAVHTYQHFE